jgi:hypothetical protein
VPTIIFGINAAESNVAAGRGDYSSILGFTARDVNVPDALVCNRAELKDRNEGSKRN